MKNTDKLSPVSPIALYATAVLFFTNLVGYLDRQVLNLLVQPVKNSLHLSDGEIGLMQGLAFVLTFTVAGLFIGRLLDRYQRRLILIVCVAVWTVSAAAGGFARTGIELFIARMGVGIGEAALIPCAVSMIADYFDEARRGRAYGIFTTGVYAGSGLSLVVVAFALPFVETFSGYLAEKGLQIEPWRLVMFTMLLPGLMACLLLLTLTEPARASVPQDEIAHGEGIRDWNRQRAFFLPHHLAAALVTAALYGVTNWFPTVLIRDFAYSVETVGKVFGGLVALSGICGSYLGGILTDMGNRSAGVKGRIAVGTIATAGGALGSAAVAVGGNAALSLAGAAIILSMLSGVLVTAIMAMSDVAPARSRAQITAVYFIFTGLIGAAGGPAAIGYVNDAIGGPGWPLGRILGMVGGVACIAAVGFFVLTARSTPRPS